MIYERKRVLLGLLSGDHLLSLQLLIPFSHSVSKCDLNGKYLLSLPAGRILNTFIIEKHILSIYI